jgi:NDP-sugar pyrophosphorylase family protein
LPKQSSKPAARQSRFKRIRYADQVKSLVAQTIEKWERVDIVVNNAGTNPHFGPILTADEGQVDNASHLEGRVILQPGAVVVNSTIRGPAIIGKRTRVENAFVGPYTSILDDCLIRNCEIEHSVILENSRIHDLSRRLADSLIGRNVEVARADGRTQTLAGPLEQRALFPPLSCCR